jgi:hypothetical protein
VIERLDNLTTEIKEYSKEILDMKTIFVPRAEFEQWIGVRKEVHNILNGRIGAMEQEQLTISRQLESFHADMREKMNRLSKTFIFRDAVISMRLDNLSDKIGLDKWTKANEKQLADSLAEKLEVPDGETS